MRFLGALGALWVSWGGGGGGVHAEPLKVRRLADCLEPLGLFKKAYGFAPY